MAQRKSPSSSRSGSTGPKRATSSSGARPAGSAGSAVRSGAKAGTATAGASKAGAARGSAAAGGPPRKPPAKGKSIVNQKQTPWGLIAVTVAVVLFAAAIVIVVIATHKSSSPSVSEKNAHKVDASDPYRQPELPAAKAIRGVTYIPQGEHTHVFTTVKYDASPPVGGNHSQVWADCTGKVYSTQIANENAVHMLEHGAVWVTYNPKTLPASELTQLKSYVSGVDRTALSPYAGLKTPISLQAWGYQLFVQKASDPRIAQFIATLKYNPKTTPENSTCSDPSFVPSQSIPGHPQFNA